MKTCELLQKFDDITHLGPALYDIFMLTDLEEIAFFAASYQNSPKNPVLCDSIKSGFTYRFPFQFCIFLLSLSSRCHISSSCLLISLVISKKNFSFLLTQTIYNNFIDGRECHVINSKLITISFHTILINFSLVLDDISHKIIKYCKHCLFVFTRALKV